MQGRGDSGIRVRPPKSHKGMFNYCVGWRVKTSLQIMKHRRQLHFRVPAVSGCRSNMINGVRRCATSLKTWVVFIKHL